MLATVVVSALLGAGGIPLPRAAGSFDGTESMSTMRLRIHFKKNRAMRFTGHLDLQHAWMLTAKGLYAVNRLHLSMGILSYAASPLWLPWWCSTGTVVRVST